MDAVDVVGVVGVTVLVVLLFVVVLCLVFVKEPRAVREPDRCGAFVVRVVVVGVGLAIEAAEAAVAALALAVVPALVLAPAASPVMDETVLFRRAEVLFLRVEAALWGRCFLLKVVSVVVKFLTAPFSFLAKYCVERCLRETTLSTEG